MSGQFAFVSTDGSGKPSSTDRSLIRSHCMRGKNRKEGSRRAAREAKRAARQIKDDSTVGSTVVDLPSPAAEDRLRDVSGQVPRAEERQALVSQIPPPPPSDVNLLRLAIDVDTRSRGLVFDFLTFNAVSNTNHPIEVCIDFDAMKADYLPWLAEDTTFLHTVLLISSAFHDYALKRPPSPSTVIHQRQTLSLLNRKLSNQDAYRDEPVVWTVMALAQLAGIFGEYEAARTHIKGLQQIISLRGGLEYLRSHPKLHFKIDRIDLWFALSTGNRPRFFSDPISWGPIFRPLSYSPVADASITTSVHDLVDPNLASVFQDLQQLICLINSHFIRHTRLQGEAFQTALSSIQTRLLRLDGQLGDDTMAERLRLGMLAFLTTTVQVPGMKMEYGDLADRFRDAEVELVRDEPATGDVDGLSRVGRDATVLCNPQAPRVEPPSVALWLVLIGAMTVIDAGEPWLRKRWAAVSGSDISWQEARRQLESIMWIGYIQDKPGMQAFEKLTGEKVIL